MELHRYLPNLRVLFLTNYDGVAQLPDMRGCDKLELVHLHTQYWFKFHMPLNPQVEMPFPKTLKKLWGVWRRRMWFQYEDVDVEGQEISEFMKKHYPECEVLEGLGENWKDKGFTFKNHLY